MQRVLIVKLAALGDTVLLVPALRELKRRFPEAEIGMIGTRVNRDVAAEYPQYVDHFFCLEVDRAARDPAWLAGFVRRIRGFGWDVGIDFDQWTHITPVLLRLSGADRRIGFRSAHRFRLRHRLYTNHRDRRADEHEARNFLRLLEPLGIEGVEPVLEIAVAEGTLDTCRARLQEAGWTAGRRLILIHPGCGHATARAWPVASYQKLVERLAGDEGLFFAFTGAGGEAQDVEGLAAAVPDRAVALTGMSLREYVGYLALADLVISGNTGAMHLAAALRRSQVVLEGPNDPAKWGPLNDRAVVIRSSCPGCPCLDMGWEFHRTDGYCMDQITVDEVQDAVLRELSPAARVEG